MKNWIKILKFTLKQALKSPKFLTSTAAAGLVILIGAALTNILLSGALDKDSQISNLKTVYIVNETDLTIDSNQFLKKHEKDYPYLSIIEVSGVRATEAASDLTGLEESIVLEISEDDEGTNLAVYIPRASNVSSSESYEFAGDFRETVKNAKIASTGVSEDNLNMAISDININEIKAEESEEIAEKSLITAIAPLFVMLFLYFLILFYGQSIGQTVSLEKTSKLMEYILTLSKPADIIFGKVTAIFCEAVIQIVVWMFCAFAGLLISNTAITRLTGENSKNLITMFMEALPEGSISNNFAVLLTLSIVALLAAFLFYCFVSALFASFAATAEDLTQTNAISVMTLLFGFLASMYIPRFAGNSKLGMLIVRLIPFTSAFDLPGEILTSQITLLEYILYLSLLIIFTVLVAILTGRVYKNRLFKRGTKGIWDEILAAITGKTSFKTEEAEENGKVADTVSFENYDSAKKTFTIVGFALLALMLGANAIGGLVGSVIANMMAAQKHVALTDVYEDPVFLTINNIICMYIVAVPLCTLVMKLADSSRITIKEHITKNQYLRSIFMIFPIAVALGKLSNFLASTLTGGESENSINVFLSGDNILAMIMVAVLAPIFEELVFRKLIIDRTRRYGEWIAILYSSLAFGLFHCNLYQIFYAFVIGILLGYVYVRTGNIILTIIMHMSLNATSSILAPLAPEVYEYFAYVMIALGTVSIIYTLIKRDVELKPAKNEVASKQLSSIAFVNSGTLLFIAICCMMMFYNLFAPMLLK